MYHGAQFHKRCVFNVSHCDYELDCYSFSISVNSDSFVDHDGYSISSEGFLPAVVDIMVI